MGQLETVTTIVSIYSASQILHCRTISSYWSQFAASCLELSVASNFRGSELKATSRYQIISLQLKWYRCSQRNKNSTPVPVKTSPAIFVGSIFFLRNNNTSFFLLSARSKLSEIAAFIHSLAKIYPYVCIRTRDHSTKGFYHPSLQKQRCTKFKEGRVEQLPSRCSRYLAVANRQVLGQRGGLGCSSCGVPAAAAG